MRSFFASFLMALILVLGTASSSLPAGTEQVSVHLFWQEGCPYCKQALADLRTMASDNPRIDLRPYELGTDAANERLYEAALSRFGYQQAAVPLVVIGERSFMGYFEGGHSSREYTEAIGECLNKGCQDIVASFKTADRTDTQTGGANVHHNRFGRIQNGVFGGFRRTMVFSGHNLLTAL